MAGLKDERSLRDALSRRLSRTFAEDVCEVEAAWPWALPVGRPIRRDLLTGLEELDHLTRALRSWEQKTDTKIVYEMREAGGPKRVPTHVIVPSATTAATLATPRADGPWTHALKRTRLRRDMICDALPQVSATECALALRKADTWDDLEFELLLSAATWFRSHDATGLTPRQVPLPGIDAKWLDLARHRQLVCLLAGREELGLKGRPARLDFSYVSPSYLASGHRRFDSWMAGDVCELAYEPDLCLIVENKDTFLACPELEDGMCVFGSGNAGPSLVADFEGVRVARHIVYWGDLDANGFEILNSYRECGVRCESILMDLSTLEHYERYGTSFEKDHRSRIERERRDLPLLTNGERAAYELLTDPDWHGHRRVEQEKIPLAEALRALGRA